MRRVSIKLSPEVQRSSEGKISSSSRATERIGGPMELPSGSIQRSTREKLCTIFERRGGGRRMSISASITRAIRSGENSGSLDDSHRRNATTPPPEASSQPADRSRPERCTHHIDREN